MIKTIGFILTTLITVACCGKKNVLEVFETEDSPIHDLRSGFLFNESKPEDVTSVI